MIVSCDHCHKLSIIISTIKRRRREPVLQHNLTYGKYTYPLNAQEIQSSVIERQASVSAMWLFDFSCLDEKESLCNYQNQHFHNLYKPVSAFAV